MNEIFITRNVGIKRVMAMMMVVVMMMEGEAEDVGCYCCRSGGMLLQVRAGRIGKEAEADSTQMWMERERKAGGGQRETERVVVVLC